MLSARGPCSEIGALQYKWRRHLNVIQWPLCYVFFKVLYISIRFEANASEYINMKLPYPLLLKIGFPVLWITQLTLSTFFTKNILMQLYKGQT